MTDLEHLLRTLEHADVPNRELRNNDYFAVMGARQLGLVREIEVPDPANNSWQWAAQLTDAGREVLQAFHARDRMAALEAAPPPPPPPPPGKMLVDLAPPSAPPKRAVNYGRVLLLWAIVWALGVGLLWVLMHLQPHVTVVRQWGGG